VGKSYLSLEMKNDLALATDFAKRLAADLDAETLVQIDALNAAETDPNICHSHDFCDANVFMAATINTELGRDEDEYTAGDDEFDRMFERVWMVAKAEGFAKLAVA
jgi:hypothetical protein